jgi:hypothetical protein
MEGMVVDPLQPCIELFSKFGLVPIRVLEPYIYLVWNPFHEGEAVVCIEPEDKAPRKWPEVVIVDLSEVWRCPKKVDPLRWYSLTTSGNWLVHKLDTFFGGHYRILSRISDKVEVKIAVRPDYYDPSIQERIAEEAVKEGLLPPFVTDSTARTWHVLGKEVPRGIWKKLVKATNADTFIFIARSGISYMEAFQRETGSKAVLIEVHAEPSKPLDLHALDEVKNGERVVIVDRVYSGTTLSKAGEIVKKRNIKEVISVGLFPKSERGILTCDYIIWNWSVLRVNNALKELLREECWPIKLYELTIK